MNQPFICFEGPSGVGKTTMCNLLAQELHIVPEVNLLFERGEQESEYWYHERQVDRYDLCLKSSRISILDGDIFQPIWYNWACNYPAQFLSKAKTHEFYRAKISQGRIAFPDLYIIFQAEEKELWLRKEKDTSRQRRNFEKHLKIIEPLKDYYRFLDQETDLEMRFIDYTNIAETRSGVLSSIGNLVKKNIDDLQVFEQVSSWLAEHPL